MALISRLKFDCLFCLTLISIHFLIISRFELLSLVNVSHSALGNCDGLSRKIIMIKAASSNDRALAAHVRWAVALLEEAHLDVCMCRCFLDVV